MTRRTTRVAEPIDLEVALAEATSYIKQFALAPRTLEEYARKWRRFERFAAEKGHSAEQPTTQLVLGLLAYLATTPMTMDTHGAVLRRHSTISGYASAILHKCRAEGWALPSQAEIATVLAGIGREDGPGQPKKRALRADIVRQMLVAPVEHHSSFRCRAAIVLLGALKCGLTPLMRLERDGIERTAEGFIVRVPGQMLTVTTRRSYWHAVEPGRLLVAREAFGSWSAVARNVPTHNQSFAHAVLSGQKGCSEQYSRDLCTALNVCWQDEFELREVPTVPRHERASASVEVLHDHDPLFTVDGYSLDHVERACAACVLDELLQRVPASHRWLFGWETDRATEGMTLLDPQPAEVSRRLSRRLEHRLKTVQVRLRCDQPLAAVLPESGRLFRWRAAMAFELGWLVYLRDRAVVLVGWHTALRRGDLLGLRKSHLSRTVRDGERWAVTILLPRSKTDPFGEGQRVALLEKFTRDLCPVLALDTWLAAAPHDGDVLWAQLTGKEGSLASTDTPDEIGRGALNAMLDRLCEAAELDREEWGTRSLRSGYVVQAGTEGATTARKMGMTRHRSPNSLTPYQQAGGRGDGGLIRGLLS